MTPPAAPTASPELWGYFDRDVLDRKYPVDGHVAPLENARVDNITRQDVCLNW